MARRRISALQARSKLRQAQQKMRSAVNKYNSAVRKHNNKRRQAINQLNQAIRTHNSRVRANRRKIQAELNRLSQRQTATYYVKYQTSVETVHRSYTELETRAENYSDPRFNRLVDLSERETANCLEVTNHLLGDPNAGDVVADSMEHAELLDGLRSISSDLDDRWRGALFALDPANPDAARHFCTSSREIITQILEIKAPDELVFAALPNCDKTDRGNATRKSKIRYFLHQQGITDDTLEEFVENDIDNIVQLFRVFNEGTHGSAGKFDMPQLTSIKKRVEDGLHFLVEIIG